MPFTGTIRHAGPISRLVTERIVRDARRKEGQPYDAVREREASVRLAKRFPLPRGVKATEETIAGIPVIRFSSGGGDRGTVLGFHGGAYVTGSALGLGIPAAKGGGPGQPGAAGERPAAVVQRGLAAVSGSRPHFAARYPAKPAPAAPADFSPLRRQQRGALVYRPHQRPGPQLGYAADSEQFLSNGPRSHRR